MKQRISLDVADCIADYAASISQKRQVAALVADWENSTHGAAFGTAAQGSMPLALVPGAMKYSIAQSSLEEKLSSGYRLPTIWFESKKRVWKAR